MGHSRKRIYDNSQRQLSSQETQLLILESLVELLVETKGAEVSVSEIAKRSGVNARTIYRFFRDKEGLQGATLLYIQSYLVDGAAQLDTLDFVEFGRHVIQLFEDNEAKSLAYVLSPFGQSARVLFRQELNRMMIKKIQAEYGIKLTKKSRGKLSLILGLVSAKFWYDLKTEHQIPGAEIKETIGWALKTLLTQLKKG